MDNVRSVALNLLISAQLTAITELGSGKQFKVTLQKINRKLKEKPCVNAITLVSTDALLISAARPCSSTKCK
jgi:hypothetical protein